MKHEPQNLIKLAVKDFAKKKICDGHLYLAGPGGRKFYLMKPGILIDEAFVKKHAVANSVFDYEPVVNQLVFEQFTTLLKELRYLQFERDLRLKCTEFIEYFHHIHSSGEHFLSFVLACHQELNSLPADVVLKMHETDCHLFRKAMYSSAFAVLIGMTNDYYHYLMLKDFYNLTMSLDMGFCDAHYSYFVAQACNHENQNPGAGIKWMESEKATEMEKNVFLKHPETSYQFLKQNPDILTHQELAEVALYQHELSLGDGFPRGIPKGQVSSWEAVVMLADSLVEIVDEYQFETKTLDFIINFQNKKLNDLPVGRVYRKLCASLLHFGKLKETGS